MLSILTENFFQQVPVRKVHFKCDCNNDFAKLTFEPENRTHLGKITLEVMKEVSTQVSTLRSRYIVENSDGRRFGDFSVDICKWVSNKRVNFMVSFFKQYMEKAYHLEWLKCPIQKGLFILAETREQITNVDIIPKYLPSYSKDNFTIQMIFTTKVNKKTVIVCNQTEILEFF